MCTTALLSDNFMENAVLSVLTGVTDAQFPVTNLQHPFTTKVFRAGGDTIEILIDLKQTRDIDTFAVVGNAITGMAFTSMSIQGSGSTDFSSAAVINIDVNAEYNFGFNFFTQVSFRFWKVTVETTQFAELSNFYLGKRTQLDQNGISQSSFNYSVKDNSRVRNNKYGQSFIDVINKIKIISGDIENCNKTEFELLEDLWIYHGKTRPIWLISDPNGVSANNSEYIFSIYGYFANDFSWSASGASLFNVSLNLRQVI